MSPDEPKKPNDYRIDALSKGLRVLGLFSEQHPALRLTEVASATGILMPTVYRIAMTLVAEGFLQQLPDGRYRPSTKVLGLGYSALQGLDVVDASSIALRSLADAVGETVNMGVLSDDRVLYLLRYRNTDLVTANIQVGSQLPAAYTSMGKVLLADLSPDQLAARLTARSFDVAGGPKAVKNLESLQRQLDRVRQDGYATQDEEVAVGLRSIAVPIRDSTRVVAAANIAVNAMEWSIERLLGELLRPLQSAAHEVSRMLGYRSTRDSVSPGERPSSPEPNDPERTS